MSNLSYDDSVQYIFKDANYHSISRREYQARKPVIVMREIMKRLGNPQEQFKVVHVAGTNGKGSTCAFVDGLLRSAKQKTGLFTSPHLHSIRERMIVNGNLMSRKQFSQIVNKLVPTFDDVAKATGQQVHPFQKMTAVALEHFGREKIGWGIIEVGVGGRLDPTNIFDDKNVKPRATAIVSIGKDHTHILGDTRPEIAKEKAGIIKKGVPIITLDHSQDVDSVIRKVAKKVGAPYYVLGKDTPPLISYPIPENLPLHGEFQRLNAHLAIEIVRRLKLNGDLKVSNLNSVIKDGIQRVKWPGRFEFMPFPSEKGFASFYRPNAQPLIPMLVDCAHNEQAVRYCAKSLKSLYPHKNVTFILGVNRDKIIDEYSDLLSQYASRIIVISSNHPKALSPKELKDSLGAHESSKSIPVHVADSVKDAICLSQEITPIEDGMVVGLGSVFVVSALRRGWNELYTSAFPKNDWVREAVGEPIIK